MILHWSFRKQKNQNKHDRLTTNFTTSVRIESAAFERGFVAGEQKAIRPSYLYTRARGFAETLAIGRPRFAAVYFVTV
jgi:hypothetical protein